MLEKIGLKRVYFIFEKIYTLFDNTIESSVKYTMVKTAGKKNFASSKRESRETMNREEVQSLILFLYQKLKLWKLLSWESIEIRYSSFQAPSIIKQTVLNVAIKHFCYDRIN